MATKSVSHIGIDVSGQDDGYPVTAESIEQARQARQRERAEIERQTGVKISDDGHFVQAVIVHCHHCGLAIMRGSKGLAWQALSDHCARIHWPERLRRES